MRLGLSSSSVHNRRSTRIAALALSSAVSTPGPWHGWIKLSPLRDWPGTPRAHIQNSKDTQESAADSVYKWKQQLNHDNLSYACSPKEIPHSRFLHTDSMYSPARWTFTPLWRPRIFWLAKLTNKTAVKSKSSSSSLSSSSSSSLSSSSTTTTTDRDFFSLSLSLFFFFYNKRIAVTGNTPHVCAGNQRDLHMC